MFVESPTLSVALAACAVTACVTCTTDAAGPTHTSIRGTTTSTASSQTTRQLAEIQHCLTVVMGATDLQDTAVEALAQSMMTVRGVKEDAASIASLAAIVADVLARGSLDEYETERLAQGLFAVSNDASLPDREARLLAIEIATLLQEAGADAAAIADLMTALQRVCPASNLPASGIQTAGTARKLSTLSRQIY